MMMGTSDTTYAAPGITSAASAAAQQGTTKFTTTDAGGHLATTAYGPDDIANLNNQVTNINNNVNTLSANVAGLWQNVAALQGSVQRGYEGSAVAMATTGGYLPENKKFAVTANWGTFRGQNAFGAQGHLRINDHAIIHAGVGAGFRYGGVGGRAGMTLAW
jgi:hypothetical protein